MPTGATTATYAKPEEKTGDLLASYRATTVAADRAIEDLELDALGQHWSGATVSMRSMLLAVLVDTTRHAGHSDIMRELIDGRTGDRHSPSGFYGAADEDYRSVYLARVRGGDRHAQLVGLHQDAWQAVELTFAIGQWLMGTNVADVA